MKAAVDVSGTSVLLEFGNSSNLLRRNLWAETVDQLWWHDGFHERVLLAGYNRLSGWLAWSFDLPVIDGAANALGQATQAGAAVLRRLQSGFVRTYALSILIGAVLMLTYILLR